MNRFLECFSLFGVFLFALACSSGGDGLTINYGSTATATTDTIDITGNYDASELSGTPSTVFAKPDGGNAGRIEGTVDTTLETYTVTGLEANTTYDIELQDSNGNVVGVTSIDSSEVTSSKPGLSKSISGYDVTRMTTLIVTVARDLGETPNSYMTKLFANATLSSFSVSDQGIPTALLTDAKSTSSAGLIKVFSELVTNTGSSDSIYTAAQTLFSSANTTVRGYLIPSDTAADNSQAVLTSVSTGLATVLPTVATSLPATVAEISVSITVGETVVDNTDTTDNTDTDSGNPNIFVYATSVDSPNFALSSTAPSITVNTSVFSDSFFDTVDYVGAVGGSSDWTSGWTKAGTTTTDSVLSIDYSEISLAQLQNTANWNLEYTDANGGGKIYSCNTSTITGSGANLIRIVQGEFHADVTFESQYEYLLSGYVIIGDPAATTSPSSNITIQAGTVIRGMYDTNSLKIGMLVVRQHAQIFAEGTSSSPIIMTSMIQDGALPARWGGLAICGNSTYADSSTGAAATKNAEGFDTADQVTFGDGTDASDNSGILKYVRVEYAGYQFDADNQFNGIALFAVGSGTTIEHVQIHRNSDDGIEFFGGTVNVKWLLVTGAQDDSIDWTNGYTGKIQFAIVQQYPGLGGDRGIEASSKQTGLISNPTLSNLTIIGGASDDGGLYFDTQTQASIYNSIIANWDDGVKIGDTDTVASGITILSSMFLNTSNAGTTNDANDTVSDTSNQLLTTSTTDLEEGSTSTTTSSGNPTIFVDAADIDSPDFSLSSTAPSVTVDTTPFNDTFFDAVSYIGAVGGGSDWTSGWTKAGTTSTDPVLSIDYSEISNAQLQDTSNWNLEYTDANGGGKVYSLNTTNVTGAGANLIRIVQGEFHDDIAFSSQYEYLLSGYVIIGDPAATTSPSSNISIDAGTVIRGLYDTTNLKIGMLVIRQHAQIFAEGTASNPIVMTSTIQDGPIPARWGGLAICGNSTYADSSTGAAATKNAEGFDTADQVTFGDGTDVADNSGVLKYVRVEYAGYQFDADNQFNGIALFAVGSGTTIEHVQIHRNSDDGIEFFGGTVNVKYLLVTGAQDDSIDWTNGYKGKIQYAIVQQYPDLGGDRGIEASSKQTGLISNPTLSNITIIGGASDDGGLYFDTQTQASIYNSIVANWDDGVKIGDSDTVAANIIIRSTLFLNESNASSSNDSSSLISDTSNSQLSESNYDLAGTAATPIVFVSVTDIDSPNFALATLAPSVTVDTTPFSDSFFDTTSFIGAVGSTDWTSGWTKTGTDTTSSVLNIDYSEISNAQLQNTANWDLIYTDANGGGQIYSANTTNITGAGADLIRIVTGEFHDDVTFESQYEYLLSGYVIIGDPSATTSPSSNITIEAGTVIRGLYNTTSLKIGMLVIRQHAQIFAEGTASSPIVMTSTIQDGALPARWGGLAICGNSTYADSSTGAAATKNAEGFDTADQVTFGDGTDTADNSGILKYVRVEYAGYQFDADNQFNGIALFAVGSGTTIENVQIHRNSDDGIEFFGGTVNVKYLLVTGAQDDSIDWTNGYTGKIQYAIVQQYPGLGGDRGIEASSKQTGLISNPTLSNLTIIGGASDDGGLYFDTGTKVSLYNSIVANWDDGIKIGDTETPASNLTIRSTLFLNTTNAGTTNDADDAVSDTSNSLLSTSSVDLEGGNAPALAASTSDILESPFDIDSPNFAVKTGATAITPAVVSTVLQRTDGVGTFFDTTSFIGAVGSTDWTSGWTKTGTDTTASVLNIDYSEISNAQLQNTSNWDLIYTDANGGGKIYSANTTNITGTGADLIRIVQGEFHADVTFESQYEYLLSGYVIIGDPSATTSPSSNITIQAGTVIRGLYDTTNLKIGMLVVRQHAQIFAMGTSSNPIIMTSTIQDGALPARWGGLAICGNSTYADSSTGAAATKNAEGFDTADQVTFGDGTDTADNSGVLEYVRVEYAGYQFDADNQFNGIALFAVGSGTNINHVQIHRNSDDGIEFFGGTVNVKYLLVTGAQDDSIDWTNGYTGLIQYAIVQQYPDLGGDRGIEASSKQTGLISYPVLSNLTIVGGGSDDAGLYFDTETRAEIYNSVIINWDTGVKIGDSDTSATTVIVDYSLFSNTANADSGNSSASVVSNGGDNEEVAAD